MNGVALDCYGLAMLFLNVTARCDSCQVVELCEVEVGEMLKLTTWCPDSWEREEDYYGRGQMVCPKCLEKRRAAYA